MLLLALLVVFESACVLLIDLQRNATLLAVRLLIIRIVEKFRFLRWWRLMIDGSFALGAIDGTLFSEIARHVDRYCVVEFWFRRIFRKAGKPNFWWSRATARGR